jgi:hypothetical protein
MVSNQGSWTLRLTSKNTPKLLDWKTLVRSSTGFSTWGNSEIVPYEGTGNQLSRNA